MRIGWVGADALLLECDERDHADGPAVWFAELWRRREHGELIAVEIVPGARTVLLDGVPDPAALAKRLPGWAPAIGATRDHGTLVRIAVRYDGEDLADVADHWGVTTGAVVDTLTRTRFTVAFCGFAPGFAYLTGLPPELTVPRRPSPRPRVPAGSVALAGQYAGIYPTASPGGWQLVGRTDARLFDVDAVPPALLRPGDRVRFEPA